MNIVKYFAAKESDIILREPVETEHSICSNKPFTNYTLWAVLGEKMYARSIPACLFEKIIVFSVISLCVFHSRSGYCVPMCIATLAEGKSSS